MIPTPNAGAAVNNSTVVDVDGKTIGPVAAVYASDTDADPSWVTVKNGYFGTSESFVPVNNATLDQDAITVPYTKDQVKNAPQPDTDEPLSPDEEARLRTYFQRQQEDGSSS